MTTIRDLGSPASLPIFTVADMNKLNSSRELPDRVVLFAARPVLTHHFQQFTPILALGRNGAAVPRDLAQEPDLPECLRRVRLLVQQIPKCLDGADVHAQRIAIHLEYEFRAKLEPRIEVEPEVIHFPQPLSGFCL